MYTVSIWINEELNRFNVENMTDVAEIFSAYEEDDITEARVERT